MSRSGPPRRSLVSPGPGSREERGVGGGCDVMVLDLNFSITCFWTALSLTRHLGPILKYTKKWLSCWHILFTNPYIPPLCDYITASVVNRKLPQFVSFNLSLRWTLYLKHMTWKYMRQTGAIEFLFICLLELVWLVRSSSIPVLPIVHTVVVSLGKTFHPPCLQCLWH